MEHLVVFNHFLKCQTNLEVRKNNSQHKHFPDKSEIYSTASYYLLKKCFE